MPKIEFNGDHWEGAYFVQDDNDLHEITVFAKDIEEAIKETKNSLSGCGEEFEIVGMVRMGGQPEPIEMPQETADRLEEIRKRNIN
jgi:hypothetical protein